MNIKFKKIPPFFFSSLLFCGLGLGVGLYIGIKLHYSDKPIRKAIVCNDSVILVADQIERLNFVPDEPSIPNMGQPFGKTTYEICVHSAELDCQIDTFHGQCRIIPFLEKQES